MSSENDDGLERDASGRFQKRSEEDVSTPIDDRAIHPAASALFGWVAAPQAGRFIFWGLAALSAALIVGDLALDRHEKVEIANAAGFYGFFGFAAFFLVVLTGWPLGRLLRRPENYYGDQDDDGEGCA